MGLANMPIEMGAPAAPMPAPAPAAPMPEPAPVDSGFPPLDQIPAVAALLQGEPPAVLATEKDAGSPTMAAVVTMSEQLPQIGLGMYADDKLAVVFNPQILTPQEVAKRVKEGTIDKVAVPIKQFEDAVNRVLDEQAPMSGGPEDLTTSGSTAGVPPAPTKTQNNINRARVKNLTQNSPSSGPAPGQGLVNDLKKRAL